MSVFDSYWEGAARTMDEAVDGILGDRLRYRHKGSWLGEGSPATVSGFVVLAVAPLNLDGVDETLGSRPRVKIAKALVEEPLLTDRIEHPKLGAGLFRPCGAAPQTEGRYWIFDVQKAST